MMLWISLKIKVRLPVCLGVGCLCGNREGERMRITRSLLHTQQRLTKKGSL